MEFLCLNNLQEFYHEKEIIAYDHRKDKKIKIKEPEQIYLLNFYQSLTGHNIFLDQIDFEVIKGKMGGVKNMDLIVDSFTIINIEKHNKNTKSLKKNQRFAHVGDSNTFYTVNVDLTHLLNKEEIRKYQ